MSKYGALIAALEALEDAEVAQTTARAEIAKLFGGSASVHKEPEHTVERVAPVTAKVIPITTGGDLTAKVKAAAAEVGASLSEADTYQLAKLEGVLSSLRGKSEQEQAEALKELGVLAIAV